MPALMDKQLVISSMKNYRELKRAHESAIIDDFVAWLNTAHGSAWMVSERPDPPDAIITNGNMTSWVEHADLYRSEEEARSEASFITPYKKHIPHSEDPIVDPDRRIAVTLMALVQRKLSNDSYRPAYEKYGPGILVVSERDPLLNDETIIEIDEISSQIRISNDRGYFRIIYLAIRSPHGMIFGELSYLRD